MSDQPIDQKPVERRPLEPVAPIERVRGRSVRSDARSAERAGPGAKPGLSPAGGAESATQAVTPDGARRVGAVGRAGERGGRRGDPRIGRTTMGLATFLDVRPHDPNVFSPHEQERVFTDLLRDLESAAPTDALARKTRRVVRENLRLLRLYQAHANALIGG